MVCEGGLLGGRVVCKDGLLGGPFRSAPRVLSSLCILHIFLLSIMSDRKQFHCLAYIGCVSTHTRYFVH